MNAVVAWPSRTGVRCSRPSRHVGRIDTDVAVHQISVSSPKERRKGHAAAELTGGRHCGSGAKPSDEGSKVFQAGVGVPTDIGDCTDCTIG